MRIPETKTELKAVLGMVNYYGNFLPNLNKQFSTLFALLRNNVKYEWNSQCQQAFDWVKSELMSAKVLTHYDPDLPITLACGASAYGLGAVT